MLYGHGDDGYASGQFIAADFSTNVWYGAESEPLIRFLQKRIPSVLHYPEPDAGSFVRAVAEKIQISPENVLAGNGATELFYLLAQAYQGARTVLFYPAFSEYEDACRLNGHTIEFLRSDNFERLPASDILLISNPNNPDGRLFSKEVITHIVVQDPDRITVVDESFIGFTAGDHSVLPLVAEYPNLCVIRSMTNEYAVPGLRLGYMAASAAIIDRVKKYIFPWRVNILAQEAGIFLIERGSALRGHIGNLLERKDNLQAAILRIKGFEPKFSETPFFLVKTIYQVAELKSWLFERYNILIRDASNFKGLNGHWFRLNTQNEKRNVLLVKALEEFSREKRLAGK